MRNTKWFKRFTEWEFWPSYMFYVPNLPYALYLAMKAADFTFYAAVNPKIKNSGNGTESKFETLKLIPEALKPKSVFMQQYPGFNKLIESLHKAGIDYPVIVKPDVGFRGMLVKKIDSDSQLQSYLESYPIPVIIQEFIDLPNECGVFYYRIPGEEKGKITSLTIKSFLMVQGDGVSTLSELVLYDSRAKHYKHLFKKLHKSRWNTIIDKGDFIKLTDIGNHNKGTQFLNGNHLIDESLVSVFDQLAKQIDGWYYGRMDVKYNTIDELKTGKNFIVLEINGTISEPTHIYDPYHTTYFEALKAIRAHWKIMYQIAKENKKRGVKSVRFLDYWSDVKELIQYIKKIKKLSKSTG